MKEKIMQYLAAALASLSEKGDPFSLLKTHKTNIEVRRVKQREHGHFSTNLPMMISKKLNCPPREIAALLVEALQGLHGVQKIVIAGPGFINFYLEDSVLYAALSTILSEKEQYGHSGYGKGQTVHMEFVSANPTGPLHVGHGRSAAYGDTIAKLLSVSGYTVHTEYYVNDAGRQMRILALSTWLRYLSLLQEPVVFPEGVYQGEYVVEIARQLLEQKGNIFHRKWSELSALLNKKPKLHSVDEEVDYFVSLMQERLGREESEFIQEVAQHAVLSDIKSDLCSFGVEYTHWMQESTLFKDGSVSAGLDALREQGGVYEKEGATWFKATDFGDTKDRVLLRANGVPTYFATDVAYHLLKYKAKFDKIINIFGADHHGYVPRISAFLRGLGKEAEKLSVLLVQFVSLVEQGQKVQMSTRSGQFVTLRALREKVGNDAARYFYIMRRADHALDFDISLAVKKNNENPVYYIQYAHARICSIETQFLNSEHHYDKQKGLSGSALLSLPEERALVEKLSEYPDTVLSAAQRYEPHLVAHFLKDLAALFHHYYNAYKVLVPQQSLRDARLCLLYAIRQVIANGLGLLGVSAPDSM